MNDLMVGRRIRTLRKNKGITQDELAKQMGVTPQAVSKWERGISYPELPLLPLLADVLECTVDHLLRETADDMAKAESPMTEGDPHSMQQIHLHALCRACMMEGQEEFNRGRYDVALMAYTRGLKGLESFLVPGEDGIEAYPWEDLVSIHWMFYLHRAGCYQHLARQEDCKREVESAREICSLTDPDGTSTEEFLQLLKQLGVSVEN